VGDGLSSAFAESRDATLLSFLGHRAGVEGPGEVLNQSNMQEFGILGDLYRGSVDVQWRVLAPWSSEVNNSLFSFFHIQRQVVDFAPLCYPLHLLPVC